MTRRGVIFDLVAAQSPSYRGRGIARYSTDLVLAMTRYHPELVHSVVLHPQLGEVEGLDELGPWLTTEPDWPSASVLHLSSVIEPEVPVRVYWPRAASAHRLPVAVTLYDLIPDIFPEWYLEDPGLRRRWRCCREVARTADAVLTLSGSARHDTINMLGVPDQRVHVIGSGCSDIFRRSLSPELSWKIAARAVKGLRQHFIIYNGAFNPRKNVDRLIEAYAALPGHLIKKHQLVIVCHAHPLERNHYLVLAEKMGLKGRILIAGYVSDESLVSLYQSAELNVFPSLYEGYGLPVVEAMACGAPTIAGANSSLVEILPPYALFDATDSAAISESMVRALTDPVLRQRLRALAEQDPPSWEEVADRAASVFGHMLEQAERRRPAWRTRPVLAVVGAPEEFAGIIGRQATVERFAYPESEDRPPARRRRPEDKRPAGRGRTQRPDARPAPDGGALPYAALRRLDPWRGGYDAVVVWYDPARPGLDRALEDLEAGGSRVIKVAEGTGWEEGAGHVRDVLGPLSVAQ